MFENLVGNEKVKEYLNSTIENKNISHSFIFVGKPGIGKKQFAHQYAEMIMCLQDGKCDGNSVKCDSCIKFEGNANPDYAEITPDGKTLKIEQIRNLQARIVEKPITSRRKVYVIDDADLMSEESQNCLLKTLEEPPEYAVIILIVSNESRILPTIKSRCVIIKFQPLTSKEIKQVKPELSDDLIQLLEGSLLNAENIEQKKEQYAQLSNLVNVLENKQLVEVFNSADLLYKGKDDIITLLEYLNLIFFSRNEINAIPIIEKTKKKILANNNYDMTIDYCLMNIWDELHS
ncbi:aAA ATPase [Clostridium sp. CAG:793]|jgi:DNA polymerase-3 subunit delta'|nr:aAA ATPase [Clostridium sp. CAG:793]